MSVLHFPAGVTATAWHQKLYDHLMNSGLLASSRLSDQLAAVIAARVNDGALAPGERLPTEQQLAATHGVSRTVVREAVHQLKSQGLLRSRQGSGVFVTEGAAHQPLNFDAAVLDSLDAVVQVVEVRRALEGEIAALAAERATQGAGRRACAARCKAIDAAAAAGDDGVAEDLAFHRAIGEATGNPQFSRLLGFLEQYLREAMRVTRGNEARRLDFAQAVRANTARSSTPSPARDAAAARRAALRHMQRTADRLVAGGVVRPMNAIPAAPARRRQRDPE